MNNNHIFSRRPDLFFVYFMLTLPFKKVYKFLKNTFFTPKGILKLLIILSILSLFLENIILFVRELSPGINFYSIILFSLSGIIYLWKYSDPRLGETWKQEWKRKYHWWD